MNCCSLTKHWIYCIQNEAGPRENIACDQAIKLCQVHRIKRAELMLAFPDTQVLDSVTLLECTLHVFSFLYISESTETLNEQQRVIWVVFFCPFLFNLLSSYASCKFICLSFALYLQNSA